MTDLKRIGIWSILGIAVAIAAFYCILVLELFRDKPYYEAYRWHSSGVLMAAGIFLGLLARHTARKRQAEFEQSRQSGALDPLSAEDAAPSGHSFSALFWPPMLIVLGVINMFIVPQPKVAVVEARVVAPKPAPKPEAPPQPVVTNVDEVVLQAPMPRPIQFPTNLLLQGIIFKPENPSAIIWGKPYFTGDYVQDAQIIKIDPTSVTLEIKGHRQVFSIKTI
jgi:hypothetical protein